MAESILRLPSVKARTGLSRSTIYQMMSDGLFPKSVRLGPNSVGWLESEIDTWVSRQVKNSRYVPPFKSEEPEEG